MSKKCVEKVDYNSIDLSMQRVRIKCQANKIESLHRILKLYINSNGYKADENILYDSCNLIEQMEIPINDLSSEIDKLELMMLGRKV